MEFQCVEYGAAIENNIGNSNVEVDFTRPLPSGSHQEKDDDHHSYNLHYYYY